MSEAELLQFSNWLGAKSEYYDYLDLPRRVCRKFCPSDINGCLMGSVALTGRYQSFSQFTGPLEALIDTDRFRESVRSQNSLLRRMRWQSTQWPFQKISQLNTCLANTLKAQNFNY